MSFAGGGGDKNRHAWRPLDSIINWIGEVVPSRRSGGMRCVLEGYWKRWSPRMQLQRRCRACTGAVVGWHEENAYRDSQPSAKLAVGIFGDVAREHW
jgi:hypothetical protein